MDRAYVRQEDGTEIDITEGVQAMYDLVTSSLDWGSGFWTIEDILPVADLARAVGLPHLEHAETYIAQRRKDEAARQAEQKRRQLVYERQRAEMERHAAEADKNAAEVLADAKRTVSGILTSRTDPDAEYRDEMWEANGLIYRVQTNGELTDEIKTAFEKHVAGLIP